MKELGECEDSMMWSTDGTELNPSDDLSSAIGQNHSGVLKIVYEK